MKVDRIIEAGICVMLAAFVGTLYMSLHDNVVKAGDKAPNSASTPITARPSPRTISAANCCSSISGRHGARPAWRKCPRSTRWLAQLGPKGLVVLGVSEDKEERPTRISSKRIRSLS